MKRLLAYASGLLLAALTAVPVSAEDALSYSISDEVVIEPVSMLGDAPDPGQKGDACDCDVKGGKGGKGGCSCYLTGPDEAWTLFSGENNCHGITAGGWTQIGYHTQGTNGNGTGLFSSNPNQVQLQQQWIWVDKEADGSCGLDWGFHFDYIYGTDSQDTQAFGGRANEWDNNWDNGAHYGHAIPQLYATLAYQDLTVKMGHFYTIVGYEVVQAPDNFFYSHAFTMYNAEPFTHTGVLAEYAVSDNLTVWGGYTAGWDTGFTRNGGDVFLGGFSASVTDDVTLIYTTTMGNFGGGAGGSDDDGYSHSFVVDVALTDKFNYVFQSDYVDNQLFVGAGNGKRWGVNQYFLYTLSDCWGAGARVEYFNNDSVNPTNGGVWAYTAGLNYKPHANLTLRPEIRIEDWEAGSGTSDQTLFGMDAIFTF